jgi:hypothetical protein
MRVSRVRQLVAIDENGHWLLLDGRHTQAG